MPLPDLPPNAVYVSHQNLCYDWGTFGWVLQTGMVDTTQYKHIIFMNSSSRGPFLPAYWPVSTLATLTVGRKAPEKSGLA